MNLDLDKLEQVARAATPGPWDFDTAETPFRIAGGEVVGGDALPYGDVYTMADHPSINEDGEECMEPLVVVRECRPEDGRFIARASPDVVLELVRRLRAAETDAKRYQWLRSCGPEFHDLRIMDGCGDIIPESLDEAIDEAIATQGASHD